jgi:hypothetical protein
MSFFSRFVPAFKQTPWGVWGKELSSQMPKIAPWGMTLGLIGAWIVAPALEPSFK